MGVLREQMERQMVLRRMSVRTRQSYSQAVAALAKHYRRRPDQLTEREIQGYLLYLIEERKLAFSSCNVALHGLRFFYHETLKRAQMEFDLPKAHAPQKLPEILSREVIERLFCGDESLQAARAVDDDVRGGLACLGGVRAQSWGYRQ